MNTASEYNIYIRVIAAKARAEVRTLRAEIAALGRAGAGAGAGAASAAGGAAGMKAATSATASATAATTAYGNAVKKAGGESVAASRAAAAASKAEMASTNAANAQRIGNIKTASAAQTLAARSAATSQTLAAREAAAAQKLAAAETTAAARASAASQTVSARSAAAEQVLAARQAAAAQKLSITQTAAAQRVAMNQQVMDARRAAAAQKMVFAQQAAGARAAGGATAAAGAGGLAASNRALASSATAAAVAERGVATTATLNRMRALGAATTWSGRQISMFFTAPLVLAGAAAFKWAMDNEKAAVHMIKVYDDVGDSMQAIDANLQMPGVQFIGSPLDNFFTALSEKMGQSKADVTEIGATWAQVGLIGAELAKATKLTTEAMILGDMDAGEATKALIAIQAQYKLSFGDLNSEMADTTKQHESLTSVLAELNIIENQTGASMQDLVVAFSKTAANARQAGIDAKTLGGHVAALVPAMGTAERAGTALKTIYARIMGPTAKASGALQDLAKSAGKAGDAFTSKEFKNNGLGVGIEQIADAYRDLSGVDKFDFAQRTFGLRQYARGMQLLDDVSLRLGDTGKKSGIAELSDRFKEITDETERLNFVTAAFGDKPEEIAAGFKTLSEEAKKSGDQLSYYKKALDGASDQSKAYATYQRELNTVLESNPQKFKQIGAILQNSFASVIVPLIPYLIIVADWVATMARGFANMNPVAQKWVLILFAAIAAMGPLSLMLGSFILLGTSIVRTYMGVGGALLSVVTMFKKFSNAVLGTNFVIAASDASTEATRTAVARGGLSARAVAETAAQAQRTGVTRAGGVARVETELMTNGRQNVVAWEAAIARERITMQEQSARTALARSGGVARVRAETGAATAATAAATRGGAASSAGAARGVRSGRGGIIGAVLMIASLFNPMKLMEHLREVGPFVSRQFANIGPAMSRILPQVAEFGSRFLGILTKAFGVTGVGAIVAGAIALIMRFPAEIWNAIQSAGSSIAQAATSIFGGDSGVPILARPFVFAVEVIKRALLSLPRLVVSIFNGVVQIIGEAAKAVYKAFSYINPFAHHSPSLVENVTAGMAVVTQQFGDASKSIQGSMRQAYGSISGFGQATAGLRMMIQSRKDAEQNSKIMRVAPGLMGAYNSLNSDLARLKGQLSAVNDEVNAQTAVVKSAQAAVDAYDRQLKGMNKTLDSLQAAAKSASDALSEAQDQLDKFSNAPLRGMKAMEDQIFANEMAQKRLQLALLDAGTDGTDGVDSITDAYARLQGEIETVSGIKNDFRMKGAGSDITSVFDDQIKELKKQQGLLSTGDGPVAAIQQMNTELDKLKKKAERLDLEKSLQFDPLTRQVQEFTNTTQELSFDEIINGVRKSRSEVDYYTGVVDRSNVAVETQQKMIDNVTASRDLASDAVDVEQQKLDEVKDTYDLLSQAISDVESTLESFMSDIEAGIQWLDEEARAANEAADAYRALKEEKMAAYKEPKFDEIKAGKDAAGAGAGADIDAGGFGGAGNMEVPGGTYDPSADLSGLNTKDSIDELTKGLKSSFGNIDILAPLKNFGSTVGNFFAGLWDNYIWPGIKNLPDNIKWVFTELPNHIVDALNYFGGFLLGAFTRVFWEATQIAPKLYKWIADLIVNGAKAAFDWAKDGQNWINLGNDILNGLKTAWNKAFDMAIWNEGGQNIIHGIWDGITSAIGTAWTWVKEHVVDPIVNGFKDGFGIASPSKVMFDLAGDIISGLYNGLVNAVVSVSEWFIKLPGRLIGLMMGLGGLLVGWAVDGFNWLLDSLPGAIAGVFEFFSNIRGWLLEKAGNLGEKLGDWFKTAFNFVKDNLPTWIDNIYTFFHDLPGKITDKIGDLPGKIAEKFTGINKAVSDKVKELFDPNNPDSLVSKFKRLPGLIEDELRDLPKKIKDKLNEVTPKVIEFFKELPGKLMEAAGSGKEIADKVVGWIVENIKNGKIQHAALIAGAVILVLLAIPAMLVATILVIAGTIVWGIITGIFQTIKDTANSLGETLGHWLREQFDVFKQNIPGIIDSISTFFSELPGKIAFWLGYLAGWLTGWFQTNWEEFKVWLPGAIDSVQVFFQELPGKIVGWLGDLFTPLFTWFEGQWNAFKGWLPGALDSVQNFFRELPGKVIGWLGDLFGPLLGWFEGQWNSFKGWLPGAIDSAQNFFRELPGKIVGWAGNLVDPIIQWFRDQWQGFTGSLPGTVDTASSSFTDIPGKIIGWIGDIGRLLFDKGGDIIRGLLDGVKDKLGSVKNFFTDTLPSKIKEGFSLGILSKSPSKVFIEFGHNIGDGLMIGMHDSVAGVGSATQSLVNSVSSVSMPTLSADVTVAASTADTSVVAPTAGMPDQVLVDTQTAQLAWDAFVLYMETSATTMQALQFANAGTYYANSSTQTAAYYADISAQTAGQYANLASQTNAYIANNTASLIAMSAQNSATYAAMGNDITSQTINLANTLNKIQSDLAASSTATYNNMAQVNIATIVNMANAIISQTASLRDITVRTFADMNMGVTSQFQSMANNLANIVNGQIAPTLGQFNPMLNQVLGWFDATVANVGMVWSNMREAVASPARFIVNEVYNAGVKEAWNKVNEWLKLPALPDFVARFATGGAVFGAGTSTSDSIPSLLSDQEHVVTAKEVKGAGGHAAVEAQRAAWAKGASVFNPPVYARGGPVELNAPPWPGGGGEGHLQPAAILARRNVHMYYPEIQSIGGYRAHDAYPDHPSGLALDIMNSTDLNTDVNEWLHREKQALGLNYTIWRQHYMPAGGGGNIMEDRGSPTQNHMDHIHALFNASGIPSIEVGGVGGGVTPVKSMADQVSEIFKSVMDPIGVKAGDNLLGVDKIRRSGFDKFNTDVGNFLKGEAAKLDATGPAVGGGGGVERWRGMAMAALVRNGYNPPEKYIEAMLSQINSESGGNPGITQGGYVDVNTGGNEAVGLLQIAKGTWPGVRDPSLVDDRTDPWANMNAALRYMEKYGRDINGVWGHGHGYDDGGYMMPGVGVYNNATNKPEPVFSPTQWQTLQDAVYRGVTVQGYDKELAHEISSNLAPSLKTWGLEIGEVDPWTTQDVIDGVNGVINGVVAIGEDIVNTAQQQIDTAIQQGTAMAQEFANNFGPFANSIAEQYNLFAADIGAQYAKIEGALVAMAPAIGQQFDKLAPKFGQEMNNLAPAFGEAMAGFANDPMGAIGKFLPALAGAAGRLLPFIGEAIEALAPQFNEAINGGKLADSVSSGYGPGLGSVASGAGSYASNTGGTTNNTTTVHDNSTTNIYMNGDMIFPGFTEPDGADKFVTNLKTRAGVR